MPDMGCHPHPIYFGSLVFPVAIGKSKQILRGKKFMKILVFICILLYFFKSLMERQLKKKKKKQKLSSVGLFLKCPQCQDLAGAETLNRGHNPGHLYRRGYSIV